MADHTVQMDHERCHFGLSSEFVATLDVLLQQHHDRLVQRLSSARFFSHCPSLVQTVSTTVPPSVKTSTEVTKKLVFAERTSCMTNGIESVWSDEGSQNKDEIEESQGDERRGRPTRGRSFPSTFSQSEACKRIASLKAGPQDPLPNHSFSYTFSDRPTTELCSNLKDAVAEQLGKPWFELAMSTLIVSNAIFCGVEVEYSALTRSLDVPAPFYAVSLFYAVVFTIELLLRCLAEGLTFVTGANRSWNAFDSAIVVVSLVEIIVDTGASSSRQLPSIRVIRMARVVRVLRVARALRKFRSLRILIYSVLGTLKSLLWTMLLLAIILYVFGILFTQAASTHLLEDPQGSTIPRLEQDYGTVARSVLSLFKAISGGVSWEEIVAPLMSLHPIWVAFFLLYFAFTYFAVLNVVTGVFCQTAMESANLDQEVAMQAQVSAKQTYVRQLEEIFKKIKYCNAQTLTLREFEESLKDDSVKAYFASIDLSIDEAFSLFKLLDRDNNHELDLETFVTGCLKLRGSAKRIDISEMMYETRWGIQRCVTAIKKLEEKVLQAQMLEFQAVPAKLFPDDNFEKREI